MAFDYDTLKLNLKTWGPTFLGQEPYGSSFVFRPEVYMLFGGTYENEAVYLAYAREQYRFWSGEYKTLNFTVYDAMMVMNSDEVDVVTKMMEEIGVLDGVDCCFIFSKPNHWLHASLDGGGMVAYTPNDEYALKDRQIKTRFGRYLTQFHSDWLSPSTIAKLANAYSKISLSTDDVKFARTRDEIKYVYENGPESCMGGKPEDHFICHPIHPVEAYASGDWAVAYLEQGDRITARAVTNEVDKEYVRVYGNDIVLSSLLDRLDYSNVSHFSEGLRLLKIPYGNTYVGPYIDGDDTGIYTSNHSDEYLIYGKSEHSKYYVGDSQNSHINNGCIDDHGESSECDECGERTDEDDLTPVDDMNICSACLDSNYVHARSRYGWEYVNDNDVILTEDGDYYVDEDAARYHGYVQIDHDWYHEDDVTYDEVDEEYILNEDAVQAVHPDGHTVYTHINNIYKKDDEYRLEGYEYGEENVEA